MEKSNTSQIYKFRISKDEKVILNMIKEKEV